MFNPMDLRWENIRSPLIIGSEYFFHIKSKKERENHINYYNKFEPNFLILNEIAEFLEKNDQILTLLSIGASWCENCTRIKPQLIKISEKIISERFFLWILAGIKTQLGSTHEKYKWAIPPKSPPEAIDPKFDVWQIPMIYLFDKDGQCFNRIERNVKFTDSYESELLYLLNKKKNN